MVQTKLQSIVDNTSLRAWLEGKQSSSTALITWRATMRAFPSLFHMPQLEIKYTILPSFRSLLATQRLLSEVVGDGVEGVDATILEAARAASSNASAYASYSNCTTESDSDIAHIVAASAMGARALILPGNSATQPDFLSETAKAISDIASASSTRALISSEFYWQQIRTDCLKLSEGLDPLELFKSSLWSQGAPPQEIHDLTTKELSSSEGNIEFKVVADWYQISQRNGFEVSPLLVGDEITKVLTSDEFWQGKNDEVLLRINGRFKFPNEIHSPTQGFNERITPATDQASSEDLLNRKPFANALVRTIKAAHQSTHNSVNPKAKGRLPHAAGFAVHLHAPWGAGKTSVLLMMDEELRRSKWTVVHFNAWEHERREPPWWPLIHNLKEALVINGDGKASVLLAKIAWCRWLLRTHLMPVGVAIALAVFLGVIWFGIETTDEGSESFEPQKPSGVSVIESAKQPDRENKVSTKPATSATKSVTEIKQSSQKAVDSRLQKPKAEKDSNWISTIAGLSKGLVALIALFSVVFAIARSALFGSTKHADFALDLSVDPLQPVQKLFRRLVESNKKKPICVFIDDLDRCNHNYIVDLLEGIQTSFRHNDVVYVVTADRTWLRTAFRKRYEDFREFVGTPGHPIGYLFLDKVFQVSTPLPQMTQHSRDIFWNILLSDTDSITAAAGKLSITVDEATRADVDRVLGENKTYSKVASFIDGETSPVRRQAAIEALNESEDVEREAIHALSDFKNMLPLNPRAIKRIVNAINLRQMICVIEGNVQPLEILVKWTVLEQCYPALVDALRHSPELILKLSKENPVFDETTPDVVRQCAKIDALRQLLNVPSDPSGNLGPQITPELVIKLTHHA